MKKEDWLMVQELMTEWVQDPRQRDVSVVAVNGIIQLIYRIGIDA